MSQWQFRTDFSDFQRRRLLLISKEHDLMVAPLVFTRVPPHLLAQPTLEGREGSEDVEGFLRAALNCAWSLGIRPDGFFDTTESMAATRRHLEDMRTLVFRGKGLPNS